MMIIIAGTVISCYNNCIGYQETCPYATQTHHCGRTAVLGSRLRCSYIENILVSSVWQELTVLCFEHCNLELTQGLPAVTSHH